jgi:hypothetical protein
MKRLVIGTLLFLATAAVGLLAVWTTINLAGGSDLEQWIGRQIVGVLGNYINPEITFRRLDYQAPYTVQIDDLRLTAQDQPMITVDRIELTLAEIPASGQPIQIQRIGLTRPQVHFVRADEGGFIGWSNFVKQKSIEEPESVQPGQRFSDILVLREITFDDGALVYDDGTGNPMTLPALDLAMKTEPAADAPGWYTLAADCRHAELFELVFDGRLNLDTATLAINRVTLDTSLTEGEYATLPPQLQKTMREHEVRGALALEASGEIPFSTPEDAQLNLTLKLTDARAVFGERKFEAGIAQLDLQTTDGDPEAGLAEGRLDVTKARLMSIPIIADALAIGSKLTPNLDVQATDEAKATFTLHRQRLHLSDAELSSELLQVTGRGDIHYDGRLDLRLTIGALGKTEARLGAIGDAIRSVREAIAQYHVQGTVSKPTIAVKPLGT